MECKDCTYFSNAYGGSCFGWADISDTKACDNANNCSRFRVKEKEPNYTPNIIEEYSEYDKELYYEK